MQRDERELAAVAAKAGGVDRKLQRAAGARIADRAALAARQRQQLRGEFGEGKIGGQPAQLADAQQTQRRAIDEIDLPRIVEGEHADGNVLHHRAQILQAHLALGADRTEIADDSREGLMEFQRLARARGVKDLLEILVCDGIKKAGEVALGPLNKSRQQPTLPERRRQQQQRRHCVPGPVQHIGGEGKGREQSQNSQRGLELKAAKTHTFPSAGRAKPASGPAPPPRA